MPSKKSKKPHIRTPEEPETAGPGPEIAVQFERTCNEREQLANLRRLIGKESIRTMQQVFPGEEDQELGTLVVVTLQGAASAEDAVALLNADDEVRVAHVAAERAPLEK